MIDKSSEISEILLELGAQNTDPVGMAISGIWDSYADKALIGPRLQSLFTRRASVDILLGSVWLDVNTSDEQLTVSLQQQTENLSAIRRRVETEIADLLGQLQAARVPVSGALSNTTPAGGQCDPGYRCSHWCGGWRGL